MRRSPYQMDIPNSTQHIVAPIKIFVTNVQFDRRKEKNKAEILMEGKD